jgi:pseudouridine synthase
VRRNQHSYESRISLLLLDNQQQQQRSSLYAAAPSSHNNNYDEKYNGPALRIARCFPNLSRRKAEEAVVTGRVKVDGNVVVTPSYRLVGGQKLTLDDRKIHWESKAIALNNEGASSSSTNNTNNRQQTTSNKKKKTKNASLSSSSSLYYKYHKPVGVTCTMDKHDRRGLFYALPSKLKKLPLFPVGRLDLDSEGLVFLTNDGPLADAMLQPMYKQEKEYIVEVRPRLSVTQIAELAAGVLITTVQQRGGKETTKLTQPCHVEEIVNTNPQQSSPSSSFLLRFVLVEGRNRQIRKMVHAVSQQQQHHEVISLKRIRQGVLSLGKLPSGTILPLQDKERNELFALVNK